MINCDEQWLAFVIRFLLSRQTGKRWIVSSMLAPDLNGSRKGAWWSGAFSQAANHRRMRPFRTAFIFPSSGVLAFLFWECDGGLWLCAFPLEWMHSKLEKQKCPISLFFSTATACCCGTSSFQCPPLGSWHGQQEQVPRPSGQHCWKHNTSQELSDVSLHLVNLFWGWGCLKKQP